MIGNFSDLLSYKKTKKSLAKDFVNAPIGNAKVSKTLFMDSCKTSFTSLRCLHCKGDFLIIPDKSRIIS